MAAATGTDNPTDQSTAQQAERIMRLPPLPNPLSQRGPAAFAQAGEAMSVLNALSAGAANGTVGECFRLVLGRFHHLVALAVFVGNICSCF